MYGDEGGRASGWALGNVLEVGFRIRFRECHPLTDTPSAFVDKGSIMKRTTLRSLIQSIQQNNLVEVVRDTTSPGCYSHQSKEVRRLETSQRSLISQLLPRDSSLHDGECGKHSTISPSRSLGHFHRSCGCLFPYIHPQRLPKISSISDSGQNIPIPGTAVWAFSRNLDIHQDYDRDHNAGTCDGHQSRSVLGRLAHLFTISRPVPPRHCTSAQSRPHDGPPDSLQEVGTDPITEIPFSVIPV